MKKHDYNEDIYYEDVPENLANETTQGEGEQSEKTPENFLNEPKMSAQEHFRAYNANNDEAQRLANAVREERAIRINQQSLILALFGLFLSLFFGVGIFLSVPAWIKANFYLKQKKSQTLVWAKMLGILGTILNALIIFAFIIFLST